MALQLVGITSGAGTGDSYTVSLTGLTGGLASQPAAGDIVVVYVGESNGGTVTSTLAGNNSGSYSTVTTHQVRADAWDSNLDTFYKIQGATPDTQLTVTRGANNTTYGNAAVVQVWRGVDPNTPLDVAATAANAANSCVINPPAITPTTAGAIIIAGGCGTMAATSNAFTGFSGMSNFITNKGDGSTSDAGVAAASYAWSSGAYDPPTVSGGTTSNSSAWTAVTMALRPLTNQSISSEAATTSFTLTGQAATSFRSATDYPSSAATTSFTLTGSAAYDALGDSAGNTSFSLTATNATSNVQLTSVGAYGTFSLSPQAATDKTEKYSDSQAGTFSLSSAQSSDLVSLHSTTGTASFSLTAVDATSLSGGNVPSPADPGSFTITAQAATDRVSKYSSLQSSTFSLSAVASGDQISLYSSATTTTFSLSGQPTTNIRGKQSGADPTTYSLSGQAATSVRSAAGYQSNAATTSFTLTGFSSSGVQAISVISSAGPASFSIGAVDASDGYGITSIAEPDTLYIYGFIYLLEPYMWNYEIEPGITAASIMQTLLQNSEFSKKIIKNKKEITADKKLAIYDDDGTTPILQKALKDKSGGEITDLATGVLAAEEASTV